MSMYEMFKDGLDAVKASDNVPLLKNYMDIHQGYLQIENDLKQAKQKIKELEDKLEVKDRIIFRDNMYYIKTESGHEDGPYCTRCYDETNKLIRMHKEKYKYICPVDKVSVSTEEQNKIKEQDNKYILGIR